MALLPCDMHAQAAVTTLVVPFPPGGPSDFVARTIQPELAQQLGETIIVDNVGGVGGALGIRRALAAPADGHTLVLASPNALNLTPLVVQAARHKPEELRPVAFLTSAPLVLLSRKDMPAASFDDLLRMARAPGFKELIDIAFLPLGGTVPALIKEGRVKAYGVTAKQPATQMPDLPALAAVKGFETFEFDE